MRFSDLHLCCPLHDAELSERTIAKSRELGYSQIGIPLNPSAKQDALDRLRHTAENLDLDLVTRLDLTPKSPNDLLRSLRRFRHRFEVVSVSCGSKAVARQAAKDRRVDLLCFQGLERRSRFFDWAEAELASKSNAAFEIDFAQVLSAEGFARVGLLSCLRREVATARDFGVPVVAASGAGDVLFLRKPQDYASLAYLFDAGASFLAEAFSLNPASIVERNRLKQSPEYLAPGIRIVKRKGES